MGAAWRQASKHVYIYMGGGLTIFVAVLAHRGVRITGMAYTVAMRRGARGCVSGRSCRSSSYFLLINTQRESI